MFPTQAGEVTMTAGTKACVAILVFTLTAWMVTGDGLGALSYRW
jgi:hypothetical protein